jgi:hypothetical protein
VKRFASLPFVLLALTGCGHVEVHEVILREPAPATGREPDVYFNGREPAEAFYEVALLEVVGYGSDAQLEDLTHALVSRGAQLGCDAILRVHVDLGFTKAHGYGVCARLIPGTAPAAAAARPAPATPPAPPPPPPQPPASEEGSDL